MATKTQIYKEVLREYDALRTQKAAELRERREAIYMRFPRLEEIERELSLLGISIKLSHCFTPEILKINDITMKKDVVHPIIDGKKDRTLQNTFRFNLQLYNFSWERKKKRATVPFSPVPTKI